MYIYIHLLRQLNQGKHQLTDQLEHYQFEPYSNRKYFKYFKKF